MVSESCGTCKFGFQQDRHLLGQWLDCRRFPPLHDRRLWSTVRPNDWCGEYQPSEERND